MQKTKSKKSEAHPRVDALEIKEKFVSHTGATRCAKVAGETGGFPLRYDLIPPPVLRAYSNALTRDFEKFNDVHYIRRLPKGELINLIIISLGIWQEGSGSIQNLEDVLALWGALIATNTPDFRIDPELVVGGRLDDGGHSDPAPGFYDQIPPAALRAYASAMGEGSLKYGDHNWWKGFNESLLLQHAWAHLIQFMTNDTSEDHLGHGFWNIAALICFAQTRPDLMDLQKAIRETGFYLKPEERDAKSKK